MKTNEEYIKTVKQINEFNNEMDRAYLPFKIMLAAIFLGFCLFFIKGMCQPKTIDPVILENESKPCFNDLTKEQGAFAKNGYKKWEIK